MRNIYAFLFAILLTTLAQAQPTGWNYLQPIAVTENSGALLLNYQLKLIIDTQTPISMGRMEADGDDIRFGKDCQGNTLLNYWIESGLNTASTTIWVKIDSLPASATRNIYMFHGNPAATAASAITGTFVGPHSATDSTVNTSPSGSADAQRGFRFAPTEDVLATSFGKYTSSGNPRYVTLFDVGTQAVLRQVQVAGPVNTFSYTSVTPIWLTQSTQYLLEIFCPAGDDSYYFGASPTVGQHIQYFDMRYCNGCTQNTYPTNSLGGMLYGYVDLWYFTKSNVSPAPTYTTVPSAPLTLNAGGDATFCVGGSAMIGAPAAGGVAPYAYSWSPPAGLSSSTIAQVTASPSSTTTYTLTVTDACGGMSTDEVLVTVNPQPVVAAIGLPDTICAGDSTTLYATGSAFMYTWMPGAFTGNIYPVLPAATTTYTVIGTDVNGCSDTVNFTVQVNNLPVADAGVDTVICAGSSVQLNGSGGVSCQWNTSSDLSSTTICNPLATPLAAASYTLTVTDANGCAASDVVNVGVNASPTVVITAGSDTVCNGAADTLIANVTGGTPGYTYAWSIGAPTQSIVVTPTGPSTCYTVQVVDVNGCSHMDTFCIVVNNGPLVTAAGDTAICAGDTAMLFVTGTPATYAWSPASSLNQSTGAVVSAFPSATTTYTVTGTDLSGCTSITTWTLNVNTPPTVTFNSTPQYCVTDGPAPITGGSPAGGTYSGNGVSGTMFNPASAGTGSHPVTYTYTDANGCTAFATTIFVVSPCVGIQQHNSTAGFSIRPNPFAEHFTLQLEGLREPTLVEVYDALGKLVHSQMLNDMQALIGTAEWPSGVYYLRLRSEHRSAVEKVIKR